MYLETNYCESKEILNVIENGKNLSINENLKNEGRADVAIKR